MSFDPEVHLKKIAGQEDAEIDLGLAALALCAPAHAGRSIQRYQHHLEALPDEVAARHKELLEAGAEDDAGTQLAALKHILSDQYDYKGDDGPDETLQKADMMQVIDNRAGLSIAIGILYIGTARALGWLIEGLNTPGRFLCRIERAGQRLVFDPGSGAKTLEAQDLRWMIKKHLGEQAELSAAHFEGLSNRDILIRLQNTIKYRLIDSEDYDGALQVIEEMRLIAPGEYRLLLDAGVLYARVNKHMAAIRALEGYIEKTPNAQERYEAGLILDHIREEMQED